MDDVQGLIFDLDTFAVHDGPGIRMAVYFKGCPLSCAWRHSPESQGASREIILVRDRCAACGACVAACPQAVHSVLDGKHVLNRDRCQVCGACVDACPNGALQIKSYRIPAAEVVTKAIRMKPFFEPSGGDITLTGGYVFMRQAGLGRVALPPYNPSAGAKYAWLDRPHDLQGEPQAEAYLEHLARLGRDYGLEVIVD